jgi:hypothetical protein
VSSHSSECLNAFFLEVDIRLFEILHLNLDEFGGCLTLSHARFSRLNLFLESNVSFLLVLPLGLFKESYKLRVIVGPNNFDGFIIFHSLS